MYIIQSSREQLAIGSFAEALLVIPNTLAVNAAKDSTDLVPKLRAFHHSSQIKAEHSALKYCGLDLFEGELPPRWWNQLRACTCLSLMTLNRVSAPI